MAEETCIVCLGSIPTAGASTLTTDVPSVLAASKKPVVSATTPDNDTIFSAPVEVDGELIAFLLPCGHFLHDECLKPWVDRANSCPICRAAFNMVELRQAIDGPIIDSYVVADKRQVAEVDATLVVDDGIEDLDEHDGPCMVCETFGDEGSLLLCDGCNNTTHVFCAGLDRVPAGTWFCYTCQQDPQIIAQNYRATSRRRQRRARRAPREAGWERIWQSVLVRTHVDLDFPFDDDSADQQADADRREFREWQARFHIADRQGAATRFRNTAHILHNPPRPRPQTQEEIQAWSAFDRARLHEEGPNSEERPRSVRSRKRKSRSNSPREATPPPTERKLKRPRIGLRRSHAAAEVSRSNGESSRSVQVDVSAPAPERPRQRSDAGANPTFLQSLLTEVETDPVSTTSEIDPFEGYEGFASAVERSPSPQASSRAGSPQASNHPSPRAMTPPPHSPISRPVSPPPLASTITPIFPPAPGPEFSPFSPAVDDLPDRARPRARQLPRPRQASHSPDGSSSHSPTRPPMSYEMKQEIQKMVTSALKPFYTRKEVEKERYTEINRDVSRMLYEKVWDAGGLVDQKTRERWQRVACEEVKQAVKSSAPVSSAPVSRKGTPPGGTPAADKTSQTTEMVVRPSAAVQG